MYREKSDIFSMFYFQQGNINLCQLDDYFFSFCYFFIFFASSTDLLMNISTYFPGYFRHLYQLCIYNCSDPKGIAIQVHVNILYFDVLFYKRKVYPHSYNGHEVNDKLFHCFFFSFEVYFNKACN